MGIDKTSQNYRYLRFHDHHYESSLFFHPNDELLKIVRALIPINWTISRKDVWFHAKPLKITNMPFQGWKIHISATQINCDDILQKAVPILISSNINFKFLVDKSIVNFSNSKTQARGSSGKFITIYPNSEEEFKEIIEQLYLALKDFNGPYILSDMRYKDSNVVYYRYGAFKEIKTVNVHGEQEYKIMSPDGELIPDNRYPFYNLPDWINDPFKDDDKVNNTDHTIKNGRYRIEKVIQFSNTGGIYEGTDLNSNKRVLIKEARPHTSVFKDGSDAVARLEKEYKVLKEMESIGITPKPIDLVQEWEHLFLIEEFIDGTNLAPFVTRNTPFRLVNPTNDVIQSYVSMVKNIWLQILNGVNEFHKRNIIIGDLSSVNVMVCENDSIDIRFIDFEGAWKPGSDQPSEIRTPGYSSKFDDYNNKGTSSDIYAVGAIMLSTLFPMNQLLELDQSKNEVFINKLGRTLGLPKSILSLIKKCMDDVPNNRPSLKEIEKSILELTTDKETHLPDNNKSNIPEHQLTLNKIISYVEEHSDYHRSDRLFPSDLNVFRTNPLSLAHGAVGVGYALSKIKGEVPSSIKSWILMKNISNDTYSPGLYLGLSGIAWGLWDIGLEERAIQVLTNALDHKLLFTQAELYSGASGVGLSCLYFYNNTSNQYWLDNAVKIGNWLNNSKNEDSNGNYYWLDHSGDIWTGYAKGSAGISLFLLYLSEITGQKNYLELGARALEFEISHLEKSEEGFSILRRGTLNEGENRENVLSHYWLDGSAGVATTILRYWMVTKQNKYKEVAYSLLDDAKRSITIFPNLFRGLSGLGNVLLDAYEIFEDNSFLYEANKVAEGVDLFKIERPEGIVFPGDKLLRASTDLATGSTGIALFLHRLIQAKMGKQTTNLNFTLDELIGVRSKTTLTKL
ncbi:class III lanthionine synthetase LanKC [Cytobacillus sp. Hm23]